MMRSKRAFLLASAGALLGAAALVGQAPRLAGPPPPPPMPGQPFPQALPVAPGAVARPAPPKPRQPVLILLYTRFTDHTQPQYLAERINLLIPVVDQLRAQYPGSGISSVFQFSGSASEVLFGLSQNTPALQRVKDAIAKGLIEAGYAGEDEPTYANRPRPNFLLTETPEERWLERLRAAERFMTEYKDPVFGDPVPGLTGGLKRMQEVFGDPALVSGLSQDIGDTSPEVHELRRFNPNAVLLGLPDFDRARAIPEYRRAVADFGAMMSPAPNTSPELYWENNTLCSSDFGGPDLRAFSADEGVEAIRTAFEKLDRSKVRIVHMEFGSYLRYLLKGPDGKPVFPPLIWAYDHPDAPGMAVNLKAFLTRGDVDAASQKELTTMRWLLGEFLKDNPGSRFVSVADLRKLIADPRGGEVGHDQLQAAASNLLQQFDDGRNVPNFAAAANGYFSLADLFQLLTSALAEFSRTGSLPASVKLGNLYGPLRVETAAGLGGELTVASIARAAAELHVKISNEAWKPVPDNATPQWVTVESTRVNEAQFLRLMAEAYLDPTPSKTLKIKPSVPVSHAGGIFPRHVSQQDQGGIWTFRPAVLRLGGLSEPK